MICLFACLWYAGACDLLQLATQHIQTITSFLFSVFINIVFTSFLEAARLWYIPYSAFAVTVLLRDLKSDYFTLHYITGEQKVIITDCSFQCAFSRLRDQPPSSLGQPHTNLPDSNSPVPTTGTSSSIGSPLSSSITPSLFHSRLKIVPSYPFFPFVLRDLIYGFPDCYRYF